MDGVAADLTALDADAERGVGIGSMTLTVLGVGQPPPDSRIRRGMRATAALEDRPPTSSMSWWRRYSSALSSFMCLRAVRRISTRSLSGIDSERGRIRISPAASRARSCVCSSAGNVATYSLRTSRSPARGRRSPASASGGRPGSRPRSSQTDSSQSATRRPPRPRSTGWCSARRVDVVAAIAVTELRHRLIVTCVPADDEGVRSGARHLTGSCAGSFSVHGYRYRTSATLASPGRVSDGPVTARSCHAAVPQCQRFELGSPPRTSRRADVSVEPNRYPEPTGADAPSIGTFAFAGGVFHASRG